MRLFFFIIYLLSSALLVQLQSKEYSNLTLGSYFYLNGSECKKTFGDLRFTNILEPIHALSDEEGKLLFFFDGKKITNSNGVLYGEIATEQIGFTDNSDDVIFLPDFHEAEKYHLITTIKYDDQDNNTLSIHTLNAQDINLTSRIGKSIPGNFKAIGTHRDWKDSVYVIALYEGESSTVRIYTMDIWGQSLQWSEKDRFSVESSGLLADDNHQINFSKDGSRLLFKSMGYDKIYIAELNTESWAVEDIAIVNESELESINSGNYDLSIEGNILFAAPGIGSNIKSDDWHLLRIDLDKLFEEKRLVTQKLKPNSIRDLQLSVECTDINVLEDGKLAIAARFRGNLEWEQNILILSCSESLSAPVLESDGAIDIQSSFLGKMLISWSSETWPMTFQNTERSRYQIINTPILDQTDFFFCKGQPIEIDLDLPDCSEAFFTNSITNDTVWGDQLNISAPSEDDFGEWQLWLNGCTESFSTTLTVKEKELSLFPVIELDCDGEFIRSYIENLYDYPVEVVVSGSGEGFIELLPGQSYDIKPEWYFDFASGHIKYSLRSGNCQFGGEYIVDITYTDGKFFSSLPDQFVEIGRLDTMPITISLACDANPIEDGLNGIITLRWDSDVVFLNNVIGGQLLSTAYEEDIYGNPLPTTNARVKITNPEPALEFLALLDSKKYTNIDVLEFETSAGNIYSTSDNKSVLINGSITTTDNCETEYRYVRSVTLPEIVSAKQVGMSIELELKADNLENSVLYLLDINHRLIAQYSDLSSNYQIDISTLATGTYFLILDTGTNKTNFQLNIVK